MRRGPLPPLEPDHMAFEPLEVCKPGKFEKGIADARKVAENIAVRTGASTRKKQV